ncbi:unnamed protein product, partial [Staurois parvus]
MLTPSCPVPFLQSQYFLLNKTLITVLVSVTPSQFSPVSECPSQSCYKSL